jgi:hypothetical protein
MSYLMSVLKALGKLVDEAVPVAVGVRTKVAAVACPVLGAVVGYVPAKYQPLVAAVQHALCAAVPALAVAGLVRDKA